MSQVFKDKHVWTLTS